MTDWSVTQIDYIAGYGSSQSRSRKDAPSPRRHVWAGVVTARQDAAERTREALLDAGYRLADRMGLAAMSVNFIVEEAGVSKGTFFHHFPDRTSYLLALHREFHDRINSELSSFTELAPGRERLEQISEGYLAACSRDRGVRALLLEARAVPAIVDAVRKNNTTIAELVEEDFRAMGWRQPLSSARLWLGLVVEAALIELEVPDSGQPNREALRQFLNRD